jgi:thiamine biosynthesis lipoprotein
MNDFMTIQRAAKLLFLFVALTFITACEDSRRASIELSGKTMGTSYHITVIEKDGIAVNPQQLQQIIDEQLQLINQQMSTYINSSELMVLNRAPIDEWITVTPNVFDVLMLSLEVAWLSNGAFDFTLAPLVNLWGFGPAKSQLAIAMEANSVPDAEAIRFALQNTGFEQLEFDVADHRVLKRKAIHLDLSAVVKGFAVDKIAELLLFAGYSDFMVEVGGELRLQGMSPRNQPWRIAIEQPDGLSVGNVFQALSLSNKAMATSGDYRNYFEHAGKRYSHTIDPATGYPIEHALASVTVVADNAAFADAFATAINVLGPEKGLLLAEQQKVAIFMIIKSPQGFKSEYSSYFEPYLDKKLY